MEKGGPANSSKQGKMEQPKTKLSDWGIALLRQIADRNQWPMARIVNAYSDSKGNVSSVTLLLGASNKSDNSTRYWERPVNKLVVLVGNNN